MRGGRGGREDGRDRGKGLHTSKLFWAKFRVFKAGKSHGRSNSFPQRVFPEQSRILSTFKCSKRRNGSADNKFCEKESSVRLVHSA
jgi:hypothetical protein